MQIGCPQCGRMLESPFPLPELAQCPFCAAGFSPVLPAATGPVDAPPMPPLATPPTSPFAPPATAFSYPATPPRPASEQVRIPAVGLIIGGILSLVYALMDLVFSISFM